MKKLAVLRYLYLRFYHRHLLIFNSLMNEVMHFYLRFEPTRFEVIQQALMKMNRSCWSKKMGLIILWQWYLRWYQKNMICLSLKG